MTQSRIKIKKEIWKNWFSKFQRYLFTFAHLQVNFDFDIQYSWKWQLKIGRTLEKKQILILPEIVINFYLLIVI